MFDVYAFQKTSLKKKEIKHINEVSFGVLIFREEQYKLNCNNLFIDDTYFRCIDLLLLSFFFF